MPFANQTTENDHESSSPVIEMRQAGSIDPTKVNYDNVFEKTALENDVEFTEVKRKNNNKKRKRLEELYTEHINKRGMQGNENCPTPFVGAQTTNFTRAKQNKVTQNSQNENTNKRKTHDHTFTLRFEPEMWREKT